MSTHTGIPEINKMKAVQLLLLSLATVAHGKDDCFEGGVRFRVEIAPHP